MNRTKRFNLLAGGISIGSEEITAGTLSGLFKDLTDGTDVLVSNWHVFMGEPAKTNILQPGRYDGGRMPNDIVGVLKRSAPIDVYGKLPWWKRILCMLFGWLLEEWCMPSKLPNYLDAACSTFQPYDKSRTVTRGVYIDEDKILFPKNTHTGDGIVGRKVWKVGRTTEVTIGTVVDDSATVKVWYGDRWIIFQDQIVVEGDASGGDSGSPTFIMEKDSPSEEDAFVGLLYAGGAKHFIVCKYKYILEKLQVKWG
jgi:hypothetical protein